MEKTGSAFHLGSRSLQLLVGGQDAAEHHPTGVIAQAGSPPLRLDRLHLGHQRPLGTVAEVASVGPGNHLARVAGLATALQWRGVGSLLG